MEKTPSFRVLLVFAIALLFCSSPAFATDSPDNYGSSLWKYTYFFEPPQLGLISELKTIYWSCANAPDSSLSVAGIPDPKFQESYNTAKSALEETRALQGIVNDVLAETARLVKMTLPPTNIPFSVVEGLIYLRSRSCNTKAFSAISLALQANLQAWQVLAKDAGVFEKAIGDAGLSGTPAAVKNTLDILGFELENKAATSDALGGRIVRLREMADKEAKSGDFFSPVDAWTILREAISPDSTLSGIYGLDSQVINAQKKLDAMHDLASNDANLGKKEAENALAAYEDERLEGLDGLSFKITSAGSIGGTVIGADSYAQAKSKAEKLIAEGEREITSAQEAFDAGDWGYESAAISNYSLAIGDFADAKSLLESKTEQARQVRAALMQSLAQKISIAEQLLAKLSDTDPAAYLDLNARLEKLRNGPSATDLCGLILELSNLNAQADTIIEAVKSADGPLYTLAKSKLQWLSEIVKSAKNDGVEAEYEYRRAEELQNAVIERYALSSDGLSGIADEADALAGVIYQRAQLQYSYLNPKYSIAYEYRDALSTATDKNLLDYLSRYFPKGALDARLALGKLKSIENDVFMLAAKAQGNAFAAVKARLLANLRQKKEVESGLPGSLSKVTITYWTANDLGFGLESNVDLELGKAPSVAFNNLEGDVWKDSEGKLFARINAPAPNSKYQFAISYSAALFGKPRISSRTVYANDQSAKIAVTYELEAAEESDIIIGIDAPASSSVISEDSFSLVARNADKAVFSAHATEGKNTFYFDIVSFGSPFTFSQRGTSSGGYATAIVEYTNIFSDLQNAKLAYSPQCTMPSTIRAESTDFDSAQVSGAQVILASNSWPVGLKKSAKITYGCVELPQNVTYDPTVLSSLIGIVTKANPIDEFEKKLQAIEKSGQGLQDNSGVEAVVSQARQIKESAYGMTQAEAQKTISIADKELETIGDIVKSHASAILKQCSSAECKREANSALDLAAAGDWAGALEKLSIAEQSAAISEKSAQSGYAEKVAAYEKYLEITFSAATRAIGRFDNATTSESAASISASLKTSGFDVAAARLERNSLSAAIADMADYAPSMKKFNSTSLESLQQKISAITTSTAKLNSYIDNLENTVQLQIDQARQVELSDASKAGEVQRAQDELAQGRAFSAYAIAKQLLGSPTATVPQKAGFDIWGYLPILAVVLIGGGAAYVYYGKEEKLEKKSLIALEKPPEDFPN